MNNATKLIATFLLVLSSLMISLTFTFALDTTQFSDAELAGRYEALTEELRCLVCQNETIAGSSAPLAVDLRQQVAKQLQEGRSDVEIRNYMTQRYGEFILYRPSQTGASKLLWLAPLLLIIFALLIFGMIIKNKQANYVESDDDYEESL